MNRQTFARSAAGLLLAGLCALAQTLPGAARAAPLAPPPAAGPLSITLILLAPEYAECGRVSINGVVGASDGTITHLTWDWDDGDIGDSWFPAVHAYTADGDYTVTVTAYASTGETRTETAAVTVAGAEDPACGFTVRLHPSMIVLRGGQITATLRIEIRDAAGGLVSPAGRTVSFTSSAPSLARVDASGVVTATGFGEARIEAAVQGLPQRGAARLVAGSLHLEPPILLLSPAGEPSGLLAVAVANADGSPVSPAGHTVAFTGDNEVAGVDAAGLVTAHRPPHSFDETPAIGATFDGVEVRNRAIIRVVTETLGLDLVAYEQPDVVFLIPPHIGSFDYAGIFAEYDVPRITQLAYRIEQDLMDQRPFAGGVQYFVNDPGHGDDGTVPCGISGNPIRLGTDVDEPVHNSCLIVAYPPATPQWGVYFHEAGHNVTWASGRFGGFASASEVDNSNFTYSEGLATAASMFAAQVLGRRADEYGIPAPLVDSILASAWHFGSTPDLDAYLAGGAIYSQINPSVLDDMLDVLAGEHGYAFLFRLFSVFAPGDEPLPTAIGGDVEQATFFVAAAGAATGTDQRARFHDDWGFPLDNGYYEEIYPDVARLVAQRDPAADAGADRVVRPGQAVALDDAAVFDWAGRPIAVAWQVVSRPAGSTAALPDGTVLHPVFTPDLPGEYLLSLTASDDLLEGAPDTVRIVARARPVYLPVVLR